MSRSGYGYHSFLNDYIEKNEVRKIMEIGVASGDNARNMAKAAMKNFPPDSVEYYGFDTFGGRNDRQLERVKNKLSDTGCEFKLYEGDSVETLPNHVVELAKMDLIFIDGGHAYRVVKSDWENSKTLMKSDTAVFFHNYDFSGPKKVVDEIDRKRFSVEVLSPPSDYRTALVKIRK